MFEKNQILLYKYFHVFYGLFYIFLALFNRPATVKTNSCTPIRLILTLQNNEYFFCFIREHAIKSGTPMLY